MSLLELLTDEGFGPYRKSGSRYVGPCPVCGGSSDTTRFVTKASSDTGKCFSCNWGGNSVKLLRDIYGIGCKEAYNRLDRECEKPDCPYYDKCKRIGKQKRDHAGSVAVPSGPSGDDFKPADPRTPAEIWQEAARKMVTESHERLLNLPDRLEYLSKRGLDLAAVKKYSLGWLEGEKGKTCIFRPRARWGLEDRQDDEKGLVTMLWIPRGIIIPSFVDGRIDRIRIRRPNEDLRNDKDPKYIAIEGGGNSLVSLNPSVRAQMPIESDLDALLVDYVAGDLVGAIPLTTCSVRPDSNIASTLERSVIILVALDSDPLVSDLKTKRVKSGGPVNALWWQKHYPKSERWPVPEGKDPGEAYQKGVDLRAWVLEGLPLSLHPRQTPAKKEQEPEVPKMSFDVLKMQQLIKDTLSTIQSGWNKAAWEWLETNKHDVVAFIAQKEKAIDPLFEAQDEKGLIEALQVLERAYQRAWTIYDERPPVIERQDELFDNTLPLAER